MLNEAQQLQSLPSHISAFGENGSDNQDDGADVLDEAAGATVLEALDAASQLPSHISAFGDDLEGNLQEVCAALGDDDQAAAERMTSMCTVASTYLIYSVCSCLQFSRCCLLSIHC